MKPARPRGPAEIRGYHAHVYYRPEQRMAAAAIRERIAQRFAVQLGSWHDEPIGPHPRAMYQVAFEVPLFAAVVPWLLLNHAELDVLVHPETGDDLADHRDHALWIGHRLGLRLDVFEADGKQKPTDKASDDHIAEGAPP